MLAAVLISGAGFVYAPGTTYRIAVELVALGVILVAIALQAFVTIRYDNLLKKGGV